MRSKVNRSLALWAMLILVVATSGGIGSASVARRMTLEELVAGATNVVVGRCIGFESAWTDDRSRIVTTARYAVAQDLVGEAAGEVMVETLGGEVDGVGMYVAGMPTFETGRDEVLFLRARGDEPFAVVGMAQGQFRIGFPTATAAPIVERRFEGLELVGPDDSRLASQSLSRFLRTIRAAAGAGE
jgi:hypothetical protein